ncbi:MULTISPECIES: EAL domain-containing protein [unclassified Oceanispirochaeta]|uniref:GGDEF/EAL domain-containing response regulator n=1 Tax=unclassified Oceanispirochaeta TaxID=2635722 RepID=UPI000E09CA66|nr:MULTISPECIES: EAL domain-containing protein [unclassified Oceanispirochaeta]MBF9017067.1 EAL domain-containing protein [Oceanispirochaeta sp. M2]NPD73516.1 EAL domain-containing protein [Oceanispirochaeta sp. M1]RDG30806.1 EAL domain-containing protein [Oceanispirochaeta sp. M1]
MSGKLVFSEKKDTTDTTNLKKSWKILVVDDDPDVHEATEFALKGEVVLGRKLQFIHANSGKECLDILDRNLDSAVIIMDAVMETRDSGLQAVRVIREDRQMHQIRIILRTGQPGDVPELDTIHLYDINDYKTKSELTRNRLLTSIITAIRSFSQLQTIADGKLGMERIIESSRFLRPDMSLNDFSIEALKRTSDLYGFLNKGLFCRCSIGSADFEIIAYQEGSQVFLQSGESPVVLEDGMEKAILDTFRTRRSRYLKDSNSLYFDDSAEYAYVLYLQSDHSLEDDIPLLNVFTSHLSLIMQNFRLYHRMERLAYEDMSLGIPNLSALMRKIESVRTESKVLHLLDINQFGILNDLLGHNYGDLVLASVVKRLTDSFPPGSFIARVSGDVFGVVAGEFPFENLQRFFALPIPVGEGVQQLSMNVGIVVLNDESLSGSDYLKNAHIALKRAKSEGIGRSVLYNPSIGLETRERIRLLQNLRTAFTHEQMFLMYQPQVSLDDGRAIGFEALIRWKTKDGKFIPPSRFIPLAEQGGLIIPMGTWVMRMAMHALSDLNSSGYRDLHMAINVSAIQLRDPDFIVHLKESLKDTGIDPAGVELEITESVALLGADRVISLFKEIKTLGVSLAIDDFGTGYSSLSSIDSWPADRLKIDRAFISSLGSMEPGGRIVDLVIPLGKKLGMKVLAEGIETEDEAQKLKDLGCPEGQGYLYGRPMVYDDVLKWLKENIKR